MGFLDGFLNKMNFSTTDEYDGDYDDMDMTLQRQSLHQLLLQQLSARRQQKIPQAKWFL